MPIRVFLLLKLLISSSLFGDDWPTYGGPNRTHTTTEQGLKTEWKNEEPQTLWKLDVGLGYSSIVEYKGRALTQGYQNGKNTLFCIDAKNGKFYGNISIHVKKQMIIFKEGREQPQPCSKIEYIFKVMKEMFML